MKILLVTPELAEIAPVGGIAEYAYGLAFSLLKAGHEVRVALPFYHYLRQRSDVSMVRHRLAIKLGPGFSEVTDVQSITLKHAEKKSLELPIILSSSHKHFATVQKPYENYDWPNHEPWIVFSRSIIDYLESSEWTPEVIHCQDAHTALIPVYIKQMRLHGGQHKLKSVRTVLTIHNLLNQGVGDSGIIAYAGLPSSVYNTDEFEYYGYANCFKAGMVAADRVTTVSKTYAKEICNSEAFGFGLEGVLNGLNERNKLIGILNGIDNNRWRLDELKYNGKDDTAIVIEKKKNARKKFYSEWKWKEDKTPLLAFHARWDFQKGVQLLIEGMEEILKIAKVALVTWGTPGQTMELRNMWEKLSRLQKENQDRLIINPAGITTVPETANHYLISDFFLMPSKYEPCGLTQMECQRYGAIPIVNKTGGLADTVFEHQQSNTPSPNGFSFEDNYTSRDMLGAIKKACAAYSNEKMYMALIKNTLRQKNSWDDRITEYERVYRD